MSLHVCCNDEHGLFNHRAMALAIGDINLQARDWDRPPRFVECEGWFRLAGKKWRWSCCADWVGNWCWNAYQLESSDRTEDWLLTDFVIWLRGRRLYECDSGPSDFFDWFNSPATDLPAQDVHGMIREALR